MFIYSQYLLSQSARVQRQFSYVQDFLKLVHLRFKIWQDSDVTLSAGGAAGSSRSSDVEDIKMRWGSLQQLEGRVIHRIQKLAVERLKSLFSSNNECEKSKW